jgi:hypothetical protein
MQPRDRPTRGELKQAFRFMWLRNTAWRRLGLRVVRAGIVCGLLTLVLPILVLPIAASPPQAAPEKYSKPDSKKEKQTLPPILRWDEEQPGCTFSAGDDGKYRYGLWSEDVGITLAVDARELQVIRHRQWPILGVFLTIHYRGASSLDTTPDGITMQFTKHFKVVQASLDPDTYSQKIQADADALDDQTRREAKKDPEKKQISETRLQEYQKSANEMIEFLTTKGLHPAHLDRANPEVSGWVFFDTKSKWLGSWKTQEEFILRVPLDGKIFEFPFKLPPKKGELLLQKRE